MWPVLATGDIIDGFNPKESAPIALETVASAFDALGKPHYHMLGNHCLYNLSREVTHPLSGCPLPFLSNKLCHHRHLNGHASALLAAQQCLCIYPWVGEAQ